MGTGEELTALQFLEYMHKWEELNDPTIEFVMPDGAPERFIKALENYLWDVHGIPPYRSSNIRGEGDGS